MKKANLLFLVFLLSLISFSSIAGNDKPSTRLINGKVINKNGETVPGAEIKILETGMTYFANMEGEFKLELDPNKTQTIQINTIGFEPLSVSANKLTYFAELILKEL